MSSVLFNRIRPKADAPIVDERDSTEKQDVEEAITTSTDNLNEKKPAVLEAEARAVDGEAFTPGAQDGVHDIEAITTTWDRSALITAYLLIWVIYFVDTMQQSMTNSFLVYVTSDFRSHSLVAATSVLSSIIGGLTKLPLAKVLDIWGRPQGYLLMIVTLTIGLVMMAACDNVQTYAAAQVFYWVGYNGLTYTIGIFIADTSKLKNRAFAFAYATSPYIATTWIGGPLATAFLKGPGWRWGFGAFSIITPAVTLPLFFVFYLNYNKARKEGLIKKEPSGRTTMQSIAHYAREFDVVGLFLIVAGLSLFLLPFSIYSFQPKRWESPLVISFLVVGFVLLICFAVWERNYAPVTFIPYQLLADRTVFGACILAGTLFVSFFIWNAFFFSFLQVVNGLTITEASYVSNIYSIGSCFFALVVGLLIRYTGKFRWLALYFGVPLTILGVGLMIHFRQPDMSIGYIVMCQIFIAFSGGTLVICEQMAAMAATSHQYVAVVIAVEGMFSSVGGGIGSSVATAIWTSVFPNRLARYLPESELPNLPLIYGSIVQQMSYAPGTPERIAINRAYGDAQQIMCIASTAVLAIAVVSTWVWRDINVKDFRQVKGTIF